MSSVARSLLHEQASHSFIRSAMRKTITAVEASGAGNGNAYGDDGSIANGITETLGGFIGTFEEGCGVGGVVSGDAALHDARVIIDMERVRDREPPNQKPDIRVSSIMANAVVEVFFFQSER